MFWNFVGFAVTLSVLLALEHSNFPPVFCHVNLKLRAFSVVFCKCNFKLLDKISKIAYHVGRK